MTWRNYISGDYTGVHVTHVMLYYYNYSPGHYQYQGSTSACLGFVQTSKGKTPKGKTPPGARV